VRFLSSRHACTSVSLTGLGFAIDRLSHPRFSCIAALALQTWHCRPKERADDGFGVFDGTHRKTYFMRASFMRASSMRASFMRASSMRASWIAAEFGFVAKAVTGSAEAFIARLDFAPAARPHRHSGQHRHPVR
jgi:hypothetical protein